MYKFFFPSFSGLRLPLPTFPDSSSLSYLCCKSLPSSGCIPRTCLYHRAGYQYFFDITHLSLERNFHITAKKIKISSCYPDLFSFPIGDTSCRKKKKKKKTLVNNLRHTQICVWKHNSLLMDLTAVSQIIKLWTITREYTPRPKERMTHLMPTVIKNNN